MLRETILLGATLLFTAVGSYVGTTVHGASWVALVPTCAGTAAGFLMAGALFHVVERWRATTGSGEIAP